MDMEDLEELISVVKDIMQKVLDDDDLFILVAKVSRKMHTALKTEGFTNEEATAIVTGMMRTFPKK